MCSFADLIARVRIPSEAVDRERSATVEVLADMVRIGLTPGEARAILLAETDRALAALDARNPVAAESVAETIKQTVCEASALFSATVPS